MLDSYAESTGIKNLWRTVQSIEKVKGHIQHRFWQSARRDITVFEVARVWVEFTRKDLEKEETQMKSMAIIFITVSDQLWQECERQTWRSLTQVCQKHKSSKSNNLCVEITHTAVYLIQVCFSPTTSILANFWNFVKPCLLQFPFEQWRCCQM